MPQLRDSGNDDGGTHGCVRDEGFERIFGLETEYGVSVTGSDVPLDAGRIAMEMFRPVISRSRSTNTYLSNGSRLYLDVGSHPEYATAEARDPLDALAQDAAGEAVMRRLALDAQRRLASRHGDDVTVHVFKNNVDSAGHSFGCHENYLVRRSLSLRSIERELLPFLISRQVFSGSGHVMQGGFRITQRADHLDEAVSSATTRARPMVNTRDEPHADPGRFRRLHVIIGDSNRSQWATMMKLATTHLVLCVIEQSARMNLPSRLSACALADPGHANRAVSRDASGVNPCMELEDSLDFARDGGTGAQERADKGLVSAVAMQRRYLAVVTDFLDAHGAQVAASLVRTDVDEVLRQWRWALDCLEDGNHGALASRVDWAAKARLFGRVRGRNADVPLRRLEQLDMDYHDIANGKVYGSLVRHGLLEEMLDGGEVRRAMEHPPTNTRAALRGAFVRAANDAGMRYSCDWTQVALVGGHRAEAMLLDPFDSRPTRQYRHVMDELMGGRGDGESSSAR